MAEERRTRGGGEMAAGQLPWNQRLWAWASWEFGRRIEPTLGIRLITVDRFVKAILFSVGGVILVYVDRKVGLARVITTLQIDYGLYPGPGFWRRMALTVFYWLPAIGHERIVEIAAGGIAYAGLEAFEGVGLLLRRRWAEYLVLLATIVFIPLEIHELAVQATPLKAAALVLNVVILVYLVWRKRLFLDRPGPQRTVR